MKITLPVDNDGTKFVLIKDQQKDERVINSIIYNESVKIIQYATTSRNNTEFNIITGQNSGLSGGKLLKHDDSVTIGVNLNNQHLRVSGNKIGIKPSSINGDFFKPNSIDGTHIDNNSIVSSKVSENTIESSHFDQDSIDSRVIVPGTVTIDKVNEQLSMSVIDDKAITKSKIKNNSIEGDNLNDELVDDSTVEFYRDPNDSKKKIRIKNLSIEEKHIQLKGLDNTLLANNSIDSTKIAKGVITTNKLKSDLFGHTILYDNTASETSLKVMDNSIHTKHLKYNSIDYSKLKDFSVLTNKLKDGVVNGNKLNDSVVDDNTLEFVMDSNIKKITIKDGGIDNTIMEDNSVNGTKFTQNTITNNNLNKNSTYFPTSSDGTLNLTVVKDRLNNNIIDNDSIALQSDNKLGLNIKNVHIIDNSLNTSSFNMSSDISVLSNAHLDLNNIDGRYFANESFTDANLDTELSKIYAYYTQGGRLSL